MLKNKSFVLIYSLDEMWLRDWEWKIIKSTHTPCVIRSSPSHTDTCSIALANICFSTLSKEEKTKFCSNASPKRKKEKKRKKGIKGKKEQNGVRGWVEREKE